MRRACPPAPAESIGVRPGNLRVHAHAYPPSHFSSPKIPPASLLLRLLRKNNKITQHRGTAGECVKIRGAMHITNRLTQNQSNLLYHWRMFHLPVWQCFGTPSKTNPPNAFAGIHYGRTHSTIYQVYFSRNHNQIRRVNHRGILKNLFSGPIVGSGYILL